jgi:regulator of sigma E protease
MDFLDKLDRDGENSIALWRDSTVVNLKVAGKDLDSLAASLYPEVDTRIGEVIPKTPAYHANLQSGDQIIAIDSVLVNNWYDMRERIMNAAGDSVRLTILREGKTFERSLRLESNVATGSRKAIGIMQTQPVTYIRKFSPGEALQLGALNAVGFVALNYQLLGKLVAKPAELKKSVGGPVMIVTLSQQVGQKGIPYLLLFFGSISLMLMIMNLLPIPILDGGHIFFALVQGLTGRPVPPRIQSILQYIGFLVLMFLMVFAFYADISSLILRYVAR